MNIPRFRIRLQIDVSRTLDGVREVLNQALPSWWNGNALQFELGFFRGETIVDDLANIAQLKVEVKDADNITGAALMSGSILAGDFNPSPTLAAWQAGGEDDCHAKILFESTENDFALTPATQKEFWLVIGALRTDGQPVTAGCCTATVREDGSSLTSSATSTGFFRLNAGLPEWRYEDGSWHALAPVLFEGAFSMDIAQAASGATSDTASDHWRLNGGLPDVQFADASWHIINPVMLENRYTLEITQAASASYAANSDNFRVNLGYPEIKYPDTTWHRITPVMLEGRYTFDIEQTATP